MTLEFRTPRPAILGVVMALGLLAGLATAQAQTDAAKAMVGTWELSNADRDRTCTVNFKLGPSSASYPIELDKKCQDVFPAIRGIAAWTSSTISWARSRHWPQQTGPSRASYTARAQVRFRSRAVRSISWLRWPLHTQTYIHASPH